MRITEDERSAVRALVALLATLALVLAFTAAGAAAAVPQFEARTLNDWGNNPIHPEWGSAGSDYLRLAPARYADGSGAMVAGPNPRYVSNRIFNSLGQDLFSERSASQWLWVWGQFVDHTFGHAQSGSEEAPIAFDAEDPLESFSDTLGAIPFTRDAVAPGTGTSASNPRQQVNRVSSFIDASAIYGNSRRAPGMAAHRPRQRQPGETAGAAAAPRPLPAARERARKRRDGAARWKPKARSQPLRRTPSSPATCGPTRTSS